MYAEELGIGDQLLPKIAALRSQAGISHHFEPSPVDIMEKEASADPLYLKIAFDEQDPLLGTYDQFSVGPGNMTLEGVHSKSRSVSPDHENSGRDQQISGRLSPNGGAGDQLKLAQIDEHDESILRAKGVDIDKDSNLLHDGSSPSDIRDPTYVPSGQFLNNRNGVSSQRLDGLRSPEDFASQLMNSQPLVTPLGGITGSGKSSPNRSKSPNKSRASSQISITTKKDKSLQSKTGIFKVEVAEPPPEDELLPDNFPSIEEMVRNTLKKEYLSIVQEIEIEEEFDSLDLDVDETFDEEDIQPDPDDLGDIDTLKSGPSESLVVGGEKDALIEAELIEQLEQRPNDKLIHYKVGELEIKRGEFSDRLKYHFVKVHKLDENYKKHIVDTALGEIFFKDGIYKTALYFFRTAYSHPQTDQYHTMVRIAQCYSKLESYENAQKAYIAVEFDDSGSRYARETRELSIFVLQESQALLQNERLPQS